MLAFVISFSWVPNAWGFCGFYVAKADTKLYNQASQVIIARNGDRTILTMANDYQGDVKDFALVVPVPVVLQQEQVRVGDTAIIQRLDDFSAPRLVEYFDSDPCAGLGNGGDITLTGRDTLSPRLSVSNSGGNISLGVTVEERFTVEEYEVLILSAKESSGLETWLRQNGYQLPRGASRLLQPYIRQNMKFFVAKVNLEEFQKTGSQFLRPLMIAYESPKFMLPIRLGMMNAINDQDLIVYVLSPKGQAEITNYRMVKIPSDREIPIFVKNEFSDFYKAIFQTAYEQEGKKVAFLEYAWDMGWCDPCAAQPLSTEELKKAGVFWLTSSTTNNVWMSRLNKDNVFITRLHVRYSRDKFPEDLMFQETSNREQFQGRYVLRHPFTEEMKCEAGQQYQKSLIERSEKEAQTLAKLTGWDLQDIHQKIKLNQNQPWWRTIWP
ncbi:MAG: DUF2330 domain-containing protein [Cyanobacteriota bacterium]